MVTVKTAAVVSSYRENLSESTRLLLALVSIWSVHFNHSPLQKYFAYAVYFLLYLHLMLTPPPEYPVTLMELNTPTTNQHLNNNNVFI